MVYTKTAGVTLPELQDQSVEIRPTAAPSAEPPAIWSRNFRYYFTARSAGLLGDAMLPVAVTAASSAPTTAPAPSASPWPSCSARSPVWCCSAASSPTGSPPAG
ncbi:hypothetical protein ACFQ0T_17455 [Kitasatospora gansuensis]